MARLVDAAESLRTTLRRQILADAARLAFARADEINTRALGRSAPHATWFDQQTGGSIRRRWYLGGLAVAMALDELRRRSPVRSGAYRDGHRVLIDGADTELPVDLSPGVVATIVNDQPYARKVESGARGFRASRGIYEAARQAVQAEFGRIVQVELRYVTLPGGYVLKGRQRRIRAAKDRRSSAFRAGRRALAARKDRAAGEPLTYPALVITARV